MIVAHISREENKERNYSKNPSSAICEAKHGYKCDVWEKWGEEKNFALKIVNIKSFSIADFSEIFITKNLRFSGF